MPKPKIMFFNDDRHTLAYMYEPPMHKEEWDSAVDELAGTPVEALMFCLGDGRTVMHDSKVAEFTGANQDKWTSLPVRRAYQNPKHLIEEGNDPLRITVERAHEKGMLLYPMLIVQNGIGGHLERCSTFRLENRHLEIGAADDVGPEYPGFECLDFKHEEVRDERFALIEETVNKYDVDGFELHLRSSPYFERCSTFRLENRHLEIGAADDVGPEYPGFCLDPPEGDRPGPRRNDRLGATGL